MYDLEFCFFGSSILDLKIRKIIKKMQLPFKPLKFCTDMYIIKDIKYKGNILILERGKEKCFVITPFFQNNTTLYKKFLNVKVYNDEDCHLFIDCQYKCSYKKKK